MQKWDDRLRLTVNQTEKLHDGTEVQETRRKSFTTGRKRKKPDGKASRRNGNAKNQTEMPFNLVESHFRTVFCISVGLGAGLAIFSKLSLLLL